MRTLTPALLAAQKAALREPRVQVVVRNMSGGVVNLRWETLYPREGKNEAMGMAIAGDGSMVRLLITKEDDNRKLYYQRVVNPGPDSDFSAWSYMGQYNVANCAVCSRGTEVSLFWIKSDGELDCVRSLDNGQSWQSQEYLGYAPTGAVSGLAAAYKPDGDMTLFFTDASTLFVVKRIAGEWQERLAWDKTTGDLTGVATIFEVDFKLLVCGKDAAGNCKVWSLVYGDGGEVPTGAWSEIKEIASAPSGSNYEFVGVSLDNPDMAIEGREGIFRCFYVEKFTGNEPYCRAFASHTIAGSTYLASLWKEAVPTGMEDVLGVPMAHDGEYAWLAGSSAVWRAKLAPESLDLSEDILSLKADLHETEGRLTVELTNDHGQHSLSAFGDSPLITENSPSLDTGCQIDFSPGYRTRAGCQFSPGLSFSLEAYEHVVSRGKSTLVLYASDGWTALENWTARFQFRWNGPDAFGQNTTEACVKEILAQVIARSGLRLEVLSASPQANDFYPDFTIQPGDRGKAAVARLLAFIPDLLLIEGSTAFLLYPQIDDAGAYAYGSDHVIQEGKYRSGFQKFNRINLQGSGITAEFFDWPEIEKRGDVVQSAEDVNIDSAYKARELGNARIRKAEVQIVSGAIRVPVNCGQQLYDAISLTAPMAGLFGGRRRVLGMTLSYLPAKAEYEQGLELGGV